MTRKTLLTLGSGALLSLGLLGGAATIAAADQHPAKGDMAETQAFLAAKGSIAEAVAAAEKQTGGKAMSAEFESDKANAGMYEVEVAMPDGTTGKVLFNPADGSVTKVDPSKADNDDEGTDNGKEAGEGADEDQDGDNG